MSKIAKGEVLQDALRLLIEEVERRRVRRDLVPVDGVRFDPRAVDVEDVGMGRGGFYGAWRCVRSRYFVAGMEQSRPTGKRV